MFQIERGLTRFDCVDYHAILGIPIDAEVGEVRKRYMKIARSLHPDSCIEANKQLASQLLSKLVNPAYEKLSQERDRAEHELLLKLLGQRAAQEMEVIELQAELAKQLLQAKEPDTVYKTAIQDLAAKQYQSLDQILELTGQLSELNLAYLIVKAGRKSDQTSVAIGDTTTATTSTSPKPSSAASPPENPRSSIDTFISRYYRRAEEFLDNKNFQKAMLELRDALKLEPNNSRCHGLMGMVYLKQNQTTMAKVHFNQALKADPRNSMALSGRSQLDKLDPKAKARATAQRDRGGWFSLFGSKKKHR